MKFRIFLSTATAGLLVALTLPSAVFAHIVVTPNEAVVGARTTFSMSVPNEKDVAVTELKLSIPDGIKEVQPTVHPGWTITTTEDAITWSGGEIPAGQRDDFTFRTQAPAQRTNLVWKAYQTYADGTTVAWDQKPTNTETEGETTGPYSTTNIVNDLTASKTTSAQTASVHEEKTDLLPLGISLVALIASVFALTRRRAGNTPPTA
ncbi:MAG TPA: DUF1775 domain-containing protein [Candidatus Saccharimonadales bacterium]|jgi:uncharacterized protein YcnI